MASVGISLRSRTAARAAYLALALAAAGCAAASKDSDVDLGTSPAATAKAREKAAAHAARAKAAGLDSDSISPMSPSTPGEGPVRLDAPAMPAPIQVALPPPDKFDAKNPLHLLARCRDHASRREWFDTVGDCRDAARLDPKLVDAEVELMRAYVSVMLYDDAERSAEKVLAARPGDPVALYYLAWSYRGRERFPEAITALKKAVAADSHRVEFRKALGMTYCLAGDYGHGIAALEAALTLEPGDQRTRAAIDSARTAAAERLAPYEKRAREHPDSPAEQAALGGMYQKSGLSEKALAAFDNALARIPEPLSSQSAERKKLAAEIWYNRGVVYRDLGHADQAEPAFAKAMQIDPSLAAFAWYYVGLCRFDRGDYDGAASAQKKSVDLAGEVPDNREALADALAKAGKTAEAAEQRRSAEAIRARTKPAPLPAETAEPSAERESAPSASSPGEPAPDDGGSYLP